MMHFGGLEVQTPAGELRMYGRNWLKLETAFVLAVEGFDVAARRYIVGLEADLQREANARATAEMAKAARAARMAVGRIELPKSERGLNEAQARRIDKLLRKVADKTLTRAEREKARGDLTAAEAGRRLSAEQDALDLRFAELEALEAARDPDVEVEIAPTGRRRILSRDGLESLLIAQSITPLQFAAGMRYRDLFEATERSIKSNLNRDVSGAEDKRALSDIGVKIQARKRLEGKVQAIRPGNGRCLQTLRLVAGEGRAIRRLVPSGGSANAERYSAALRLALDVCADHWGMQ